MTTAEAHALVEEYSKFLDEHASMEICGCPVVVYGGRDGVCRHLACEGVHEECGTIIMVGHEQVEDEDDEPL
jgi:hypothetical protein